MPISFNADEILQMAEQIERNGVKFYSLAAEHFGEFKDIFSKLANQEKEHLAVFSEMRAGLSASERESTTYDPQDENALYLQAMADRNVFMLDDDPKKAFGEKVSFADIINLATGKEKDSIVFYVGMKGVVPGEIGGGRIDLIIKEEFRHISVLRKLLTGR